MCQFCVTVRNSVKQLTTRRLLEKSLNLGLSNRSQIEEYLCKRHWLQFRLPVLQILVYCGSYIYIYIYARVRVCVFVCVYVHVYIRIHDTYIRIYERVWIYMIIITIKSCCRFIYRIFDLQNNIWLQVLYCIVFKWLENYNIDTAKTPDVMFRIH
jgi:hypothetical protein